MLHHDLIRQALWYASPFTSVHGRLASGDPAGGLIFGWNSLALVLRQQGFYAPSGSYQEDKLTIVYTIGVFAVHRLSEAVLMGLRAGAGKRFREQSLCLEHAHAALRSAFHGMCELTCHVRAACSIEAAQLRSPLAGSL